MTIQEMFAQGMSREEVAAELVKGKVASSVLRARFVIALVLGEIDGDVVGEEPSEFDAVFRQRLQAVWEQRQRAATGVQGDD